MKIIYFFIPLMFLSVFSGCASNQNNLHSHKVHESNQIAFQASKKHFIESLKKEILQKNSYELDREEKEDELFIYKQLMKQNF